MNQNRTNLLIGILLGIFLMGIVFYFRTTISEQAPPFLIGFLTCLALMSSILIIGGIWFRKQIQDSLVGKTEDTQRPSDAFKSSMTSLAQQYLPNSSSQEIQASIRFLQTFIWGRTVYTLLGVLVSIFIALGGILGSILIFKQNSLLETQTDKIVEQTDLLAAQNKTLLAQNELFDDQIERMDAQTELLSEQTRLFGRQNDLVTDQNRNVAEQTRLFGKQNLLVEGQNTRIDSQLSLMAVQNDRLNLQNNLIEADRRSSLVFLMSNILDKVDEEIREQRDSLKKQANYQPDSVKYRLSKPLINRIVGLSRAFRPYRMMEGDTLSEKLVSPERGQLFIALMENNLDSLTQQTIATNGDFSYAVIGEINLQYAELSSVKLTGADLRHADLIGANLRYADLRKTDLRDADFMAADFRGTDLRRANLIGANFRSADLSRSYLIGADLRTANFRDTNLRYVILIGADLGYAYLLNAKYISKGQLIETLTLYEAEGLDSTLQAAIRAEKPCLFEKPEYDDLGRMIYYPCDNN